MRKILVVDNTPLHLDAARAQFADKARYDLDTATEHLAAMGKIGTTAYDVVLIDLLMPWGPLTNWSAEGERRAADEGPVGVFLALYAAEMAAKSGREVVIGVLTDANHHEHPACAALDYRRDVWRMGGVTMSLRNWSAKGAYRPEDLGNAVAADANQMTDDQWEDYGAKKLVLAKNWKAFLEFLDGKQP